MKRRIHITIHLIRDKETGEELVNKRNASVMETWLTMSYQWAVVLQHVIMLEFTTWHLVMAVSVDTVVFYINTRK